MKNLRLSLCCAALATLLAIPLAHSAGFQFYELGTPIIGTAGVGQASIASDASTSYFNPAGMTALPTSEFMLGSQLILPYMNFSPNNATTIRGNNGGNAGSLIPGVGFYYAYSATPRLKLGVSFTSPYGGVLNYDTHWVGRYIVQQMTLYTLNLNPVLAYQVNDWLAVGGGVAIEYANLYQTVAIPIVPSLLDGQATLKFNNTSPGVNLGVLLTSRQTTKIGIAFRSQIVHNLRGSIGFLNLSATPSATTKLVTPANVIASITQQASERLTLLGELGWANWSSMVDTIVTVRNYSAVTPQNWRDTYRIGLGAQYQLISSLLVQAGISYDTSPTTSSRRLPDLPMDRQIRVGAGLQYAMARAVTLGLSYEYLNFGSGSIDNVSTNGILSGSYSRNYANVVQASLNVNC